MSNGPKTGGIGGAVKLLALFDFEAVERTELNLRKGDILHGVELRGMWWWGYNDKGIVGEFPVTHVQAVEAVLEAEDIEVKCLDTGDTVSAALLNTSVDVAIVSDSDDEEDSDGEGEGGGGGGGAATAAAAAADGSSRRGSPRTELKRGFMLKRSVWWRRWRRRFFILEPGTLKMYLVETDPEPKKLIALDGARLAYSSLRSKGAFCLTVQGGKENIYLCAFTDEERNDWMNKISRARPAASKVKIASSAPSGGADKLGAGSELAAVSGGNASEGTENLDSVLVLITFLNKHCRSTPALFTDTRASAQYVESLFADDLAAVVTALGNPNPEALQEILFDEAGKPATDKAFLMAAALKKFLRQRQSPLIPCDMYDKVLFKFKWWREHSLRDQVVNIGRLLDVMPALEHETLAKLCRLLEDTRGSTSAFVLAYTFGPSILRSDRDPAKLMASADAGDLKKLKIELVVNPRLVNSFLTMLIKYNAAVFHNDMRIVEREEVDAGIASTAAGPSGNTVISLQDRITAVTRARLIKVYSEKNPDKLAHVDQLCYKYRGKEREMLQVIRLRYGVSEKIDEGLPTDGAPNGSNAVETAEAVAADMYPARHRVATRKQRVLPDDPSELLTGQGQSASDESANANSSPAVQTNLPEAAGSVGQPLPDAGTTPNDVPDDPVEDDDLEEEVMELIDDIQMLSMDPVESVTAVAGIETFKQMQVEQLRLERMEQSSTRHIRAAIKRESAMHLLQRQESIKPSRSMAHLRMDAQAREILEEGPEASTYEVSPEQGNVADQTPAPASTVVEDEEEEFESIEGDDEEDGDDDDDATQPLDEADIEVDEERRHRRSSAERCPPEFERFNTRSTARGGDFLIDVDAVQPLSCVGAGSYGKVFKAKYDGFVVAAKTQSIFNNVNIDKYLRTELSVLKNLRHPHLLRYVGACWCPIDKLDKFESLAVDVPSAQADDDGNAIAGAVVIVTEFLDGGNLREMWQGREKAGQTLRWDTVTGVFMEIAHALHYLHENGIVHRDIKPDNVLLDTSLRCKLCDFGLARYGDSLTDNDALPMTICGTDEFMAPEVIFGEPYDCRADVYSFGLLMAEVLCKRCPGPSFLNRSPRTRFKLDMDEFHSAVDDASAKAEEAGIGRCPESLKLLVEECLTYEPDDRSTVDEVIDWLSELYEELRAGADQEQHDKNQARMSRAFKQHMESADPREVVAKVHQRRPTSVAIKGSKMHMLSDVLEESGSDGGSPLNDGASNKAGFMQMDMIAKFSKQWLETQINLLVGVIARIGTQRHGTISILFGDLLVAYQDIPDSLLGVLELAREQRLIDFHAGSAAGDGTASDLSEKTVISLTAMGSARVR